jgi:Predicted metalloendopeptidase
MSRVTSLGGLLFAVVLVWCPGTIAFAQALDRPDSDLEPGVDSSISPGDDFFAYANGSWLQATEIPAGKDRWNARSEIGELTRRRSRNCWTTPAPSPWDRPRARWRTSAPPI